MIGMILGNRYEIIKEIGSGGMANVYLARCRVLNRYVAVKVLKPEFANDKEFLSRFNKEAQAAAAINSPNIVNVYDVGHEGDTHYIVMEYVEGKTLKEYIEINGMLSWQQTVDYAIQICTALDKAHKHGIVHRDIKPQNIILTNDGVLKVTDFGIARASSAETVNMGESTMGSVHYFSPEQARGGYTDEKSDLYSLGVVMYELITGRLPFNGDTPIAIAIKHIQEKPVSPKEYNVAVPLAVESIILKAMAKEQNLRYQSAEEMLSDLYAAKNSPDHIPEPQTATTDTIKLTPVDEQNLIKEKQEFYETPAHHRQSGSKSNKKKKPSADSSGSTKKAVLLAVLSAFAILAVIAVLGFSMMGGCSREVEVPNLEGKLYEDVIEEYKNEDFTITIEQYVDSDEYEPGYIVSQTPKGGRMTKQLTEIKVKVVKDSNSFIMSDFENKTVSEMKKTLVKEIKLYDITFDEVEEDNPDIEKGKITRTYPPAGSKVEKGTTITVYVSKGGVKVPYLIGLTLKDATEALSKNGLSLGNVTPSDADDTYVVIEQSHDPDTNAAEGTKVDLTLRKASNHPDNNDNSGNNSSDNNTSSGTITTKTITVVIPRENPTTDVRVVQDGKVIHSQTHNASEGSVDISVSGSGTSKIDIYFDGVYNNTVTVEL